MFEIEKGPWVLKEGSGLLMPATTEFERSIERKTGESIDYLRNTPLAQLRIQVEKRLGRSLSFPTLFPFIGRGNVMRNDVISRKQIERQLDEALYK